MSQNLLTPHFLKFFVPKYQHFQLISVMEEQDNNSPNEPNESQDSTWYSPITKYMGEFINLDSIKKNVDEINFLKDIEIPKIDSDIMNIPEVQKVLEEAKSITREVVLAVDNIPKVEIPDYKGYVDHGVDEVLTRSKKFSSEYKLTSSLLRSHSELMAFGGAMAVALPLGCKWCNFYILVFIVVFDFHSLILCAFYSFQ